MDKEQNKAAAKRFFRKTLKATPTQKPRLINVDNNPAYPAAIDDLKAERHLPKTSKLRQVRYLNNTVEQDHRFLKRLVKPGLGFGSFHTARRPLRGYEAIT
ncbi:DDE-type integrase/transposase/recombinase [Myxosarcina sp. GI1(2024)]